MHYVCTLEQAKELINRYDRFWVSNCECRESKGECSRSRMDLCLLFTPDFPPTGSGFREITHKEVEGILEEAEQKHLVPRPFRNTKQPDEIYGICFCCDDCCEYFLNPKEVISDKGDLIESTNLDLCKVCGSCTAVCYFGARKLIKEELFLFKDDCYGWD